MVFSFRFYFLLSSRCPNRFKCDKLLSGNEWMQIMNYGQEFAATTKRKFLSLLLALDFDGVLTDNRVCVDENGKESVFCCREDSLGIERLKKSGVNIVVISKETNPVVAKRCQKLKIPCYQGNDDKLTALKEIAKKHAFNSEQIVFVGNDINDVECLEWAGSPIIVADAAEELKTYGFFITTKLGGKGAVREVADWILKSKKKSLE